MKKLSIIVAAGIVTFSVTSGAQATCNFSPLTDSGLTGLTLANDNPSPQPVSDVFTNVITNSGTGDGGELLSIFGPVIACASGLEEDPNDDDPTGADIRQ